MGLFFNKKANDLRCPVCLQEWNQTVMMHAGMKGCPYCKTTFEPMKIDHDGFVELNWQDLRVLANYSQRWASMFDLTKKGNSDAVKALEHIFQKLRTNRPEGALPLTPPFEVVVVKGDQDPENKIVVRKQLNLDIQFPDKVEFAKDESGKIPSPFLHKKV